MADNIPQKDPLRHVLGACGGLILAQSIAVVSPLVVGGLVLGLGAGEIEAGVLITVELLVLGVVSIIAAPLIVRGPLRMQILFGGALMALGNYGASQVTDFDDLYLWRITAGVGNGLVLASVNAAIARARAPGFLFGLGWTAIYIVTTLVALLIFVLPEALSHQNIYRCLLVIVACSLPMALLLPRASGATVIGAIPKGGGPIGSVLMLGIAFVMASMLAYYAFLERIASDLGADTGQAAAVIMAAQIAGLIGAGAASLIARWTAIVKPLLLFVAVHAAAVAAAVLTDELAWLRVFAFAEALSFLIVLPLMMALAAVIDRSGRWAAVAGGVVSISASLGPFIGGALIETYGFASLGWLNLAAALPAIAIFYAIGRASSLRGAAGDDAIQ
jgi:predicted MFS family arabinose efflux permease